MLVLVYGLIYVLWTTTHNITVLIITQKNNRYLLMRNFKCLTPGKTWDLEKNQTV